MKNELMNYGYENPANLVEKRQQIEKTNKIEDDWGIVEKKEILAENNHGKGEIELYDESIQFEENFKDGSNVKYVLLPIYKNNKKDEYNYTKLINAGSKVILNKKKVMDKYSEGLNYFILDYDSIFGLRLLSFQRYKSDFFSCEERVLFETIIIKFHQFLFREFFYSFSNIQKELGIKKDKANTIVKKFIKMEILSSHVKTTVIKGRPSQVTYYNVNANKVIELIPLVYNEEFQEQSKDELIKYLEPAINRRSKIVGHPIDITSIMQ